jgi:hypothetical protein
MKCKIKINVRSENKTPAKSFGNDLSTLVSYVTLITFLIDTVPKIAATSNTNIPLIVITLIALFRNGAQK